MKYEFQLSISLSRYCRIEGELRKEMDKFLEKLIAKNHFHWNWDHDFEAYSGYKFGFTNEEDLVYFRMRFL